MSPPGKRGGQLPRTEAPERIVKIREMRAAGLTLGQVGYKLGLKPKHISQLLKYWEGR